MQPTAPDLLTVAIISAGSAIVGSLLTIFLTPRTQHYFWTRQKLAERRLAVADEINRLASELVTDVTEGLRTQETFFPSVEFFKSWTPVDRQFRVFFSGRTRGAYFAMENMMTRDTGIHRQEVDLFYPRQLEALTALYREVGLLQPSVFVQIGVWVRAQFVRLTPWLQVKRDGKS